MFKKTVLVGVLLLVAVPALADVDTAWVRRYASPQATDHYSHDIAVDSDGNVYVTGAGIGYGLEWDCVTIKYYPDGQQAWIRRYDWGVEGGDAIVVDESGNVCIAGRSCFGPCRCLTIKYDTDGSVLFAQTYEGPDQTQGLAVATDDSGNVYVAGRSDQIVSGIDYDYFTLKYDASGNLAWVQTYNGWADYDDEAHALTVDQFGNVYVTGWSSDNLENHDYATIKYYPNGDTAWVRRHNGGEAVDIVVDELGDVQVTGTSNGLYMTLKYDTDGNWLWTRTHSYGEAAGIALDASGNVYVTGTGVPYGGAPVSGFVTVKYDGDGNWKWTRTYSGLLEGEEQASDIEVDKVGNVYVTGTSEGDYATVKYDSDGVLLWAVRYTDGNAVALAPDTLGNVHVTGTGGASSAFTTLKYDSGGNELWAETFNNLPLDDRAYAVTADVWGNTYVTGQIENVDGSLNIVSIKYGPDGEQLWLREYPGEAWEGKPILNTVDASGNPLVAFTSYGYVITIKHYPDGEVAWERSCPGSPTAIATDGDGNVFLTGYRYYSFHWNYITMKYSPDGELLWERAHDGEGHRDDFATAMTVDDSGNAYVTGYAWGPTNGYDFATIKYDPIGAKLWDVTWDRRVVVDEIPHAIAVDNAGNVYVTGESRVEGGSDYATVKYDSAGNELWARIYTGTGTDLATAVGVDASGNAYVTGRLSGYNNHDYGTVKYDPDGNEIWSRRYDGPGSESDLATAMVVTGSGNVYITGQSWDGVTGNDVATVKYDSDGSEVWVERYDGPANSDDCGAAMTMTSGGALYVTGWSTGEGTALDYTTIKYVESGGQAGDANGDGAIDAGDVIYLLSYLYRDGIPPDPLEAGDANGDGAIGPGDVVYLINYLFRGGPPPG